MQTCAKGYIVLQEGICLLHFVKQNSISSNFVFSTQLLLDKVAFVKKFWVYSEMLEDQREKKPATVKTWMQSAQLHLDGAIALAKRAKGWLS